jgi:hypothetical protein
MKASSPGCSRWVWQLACQSIPGSIRAMSFIWSFFTAEECKWADELQHISSQLQKQAHLILLDIFYTQIARQKQKIAKVTILSVPTKPNQTEKNKCNYNLVSICDKVSDHHLHHERQLLAAITPHWLHQLLTVGVDNYTTICLEFQANKYRKVCILNFHHISGSSYDK